jgi:hypothetical protein
MVRRVWPNVRGSNSNSRSIFCAGSGRHANLAASHLEKVESVIDDCRSKSMKRDIYQIAVQHEGRLFVSNWHW